MNGPEKPESCHCRRFVALDSKGNETTPDKATGYVMHPDDRPRHRGRDLVKIWVRELAKRAEGKR